MKKLLMYSGLLSLSSLAHAQVIPLDRLLQINSGNFCVQQNSDNQVNMAKFFNMQANSNFSMAGVNIDAVVVDVPTLNINATGDQLKADLLKKNPPQFAKSDVESASLKNVYGIIHSVNMRFNMKAAVLANLINSRFPGIDFKSDSFQGSYVFTPKADSLDQAKTIKEFTALMDNATSEGYLFKVADLTGQYAGQSILSYQCKVNLVTSTPAQTIANNLGQR